MGTRRFVLLAWCIGYSRYAGKCNKSQISQGDAAGVSLGRFLRVHDESTGRIEEQDTFFEHQPFDVIQFSSQYFLVPANYRSPTHELPGEDEVHVFTLKLARRDSWPGLTIDEVPELRCDLRAEIPWTGQQRNDR